MIELYTDASVSKGKAIATCFIIDSSKFLGLKYFEYDDIKAGIHGELLGIRDGIRFALSIVKTKEPITIYCDSNAALSFIESHSTNNMYKSVISEICSLRRRHDMNFILIKGHQINHNPNKVVDLISNSILRYKVPNRSS